MENQKENSVWIWVLVLVIVIGSILFFVFRNKPAVVPAIVENDTQQTTPPVEPTESVEDTTPLPTGVSAVSISYASALAKYATRRIQLDPTCQAYPNTVTYKDNTGIMIDNRSAQTRTVKVGTTFTIKPYGFRIVVLPDIYLKSKTLLVDCDQSQNVATILVQE